MKLTDTERKNLVKHVMKIDAYIQKSIKPYILATATFPEDKDITLYVTEKKTYIFDNHFNACYPFSEGNSMSNDYPLFPKNPSQWDMEKITEIMVKLIMNWEGIKSQLTDQIEYYKKVKTTIATFTV